MKNTRTRRPELFYDHKTQKWYHWDEVYFDRHGPFDTEEAAEEALEAYCRWLHMEPVDKADVLIDEVLNRTATRLKEANRKRGNAWEDIGLMGLFLEVRTMYLRLRHLVWDELTHPDHDWDRFTQNHKANVANCLLDMRAYATLCELALDQNNYFGKGGDEELKNKEVSDAKQSKDT